MPKISSKKPITSFQERVYQVVREIPKGKVVSYKIVARTIGKPKAYRAVGNALNKNRNPKIPCYRVIRSNGRVGGYNKGVKKKIYLLKKEGVDISSRRLS